MWLSGNQSIMGILLWVSMNKHQLGGRPNSSGILIMALKCPTLHDNTNLKLLLKFTQVKLNYITVYSFYINCVICKLSWCSDLAPMGAVGHRHR